MLHIIFSGWIPIAILLVYGHSPDLQCHESFPRLLNFKHTPRSWHREGSSQPLIYGYIPEPQRHEDSPSLLIHEHTSKSLFRHIKRSKQHIKPTTIVNRYSRTVRATRMSSPKPLYLANINGIRHLTQLRAERDLKERTPRRNGGPGDNIASLSTPARPGAIRDGGLQQIQKRRPNGIVRN